MPTPTAPHDDHAQHAPPAEAAAPRPASMALVREVQGPSNDRGRVAGLAMVCSAAGVALGFALAGTLFAAMGPARASMGPAGWSSCSGTRWHSAPMDPYFAVDHARPWLGVTVSVGQRPTAPILTGVVSDTPADRAGLRAGDRITTFDGRTIDSSRDLLRVIQAHRPGDVVSLGALGTDGRQIAATIRLDTMPIR